MAIFIIFQTRHRKDHDYVIKKIKFCKKKLHKHIAKKKAMLVLVISEHLPCIPVCFSLILSVIPSGKKCHAFSVLKNVMLLSSVQNQHSNSWKKNPKTKQTQLPGLNYWVWFQFKDSVEILQYLVPWSLILLTSQGSLSYTVTILYRNIFKEELVFEST